MSNEAIINYIFKSKFDSSLLLKNSLLNDLNNYIENTPDNELYDFSNVNIHQYIIESKTQYFKNIHDERRKDLEKLSINIEERAGKLSNRLLKSKSLLSVALLAEKKLTGESFTAIIPLTSEYANDINTSATIKDNLILGIKNDQIKGEEYIILENLNFIAEDFTFLSINSSSFPRVLRVYNNKKTYSQVRVEIPPIIRSGIINIEFDSYQVISILNQNNYEIIEKHITKEVSIPVDTTMKNIKIRFHSAKDQNIKILKSSYTDKIFTEEVVYETKPFLVNENLSYLSIEACDNYTDPNIDIKYYIGINNEDYEEFRPNGKYKSFQVKDLQSIISIDKYYNNDIITLNNGILEDGVFKFYPEDISIVNNKVKILELKLGTDIFRMEDYKENLLYYDLILYNQKDFKIYLNNNQSIQLNGETINSINNTEVIVKKGLNRIKLSKDLWKETINLKESYIKTITNTYLEIVNRNTEEVTRVNNIYSTNQESTNSIYLQLLEQNTDVYLKEINVSKRVNKENYVEYFYKYDVNTMYIASYLTQKNLQYIQIKTVMKSLDKITCPYISKLLIKGI